MAEKPPLLRLPFRHPPALIDRLGFEAMTSKKTTNILILGGGFGGVYTALEFQRRLKKTDDVVVTLVNRDNFFLFTPMLHEVAAGELDPTAIVNPLRKLLKRVRLFTGSVRQIDLEGRSVTVCHGDEDHEHQLPFDHIVLGLGCVTHSYGLPGVAERALSMKTLDDAVFLRNRIIANLEEADFECCASIRRRLLTFVVAGGGFAGVETAGSVIDLLHESLPHYPNVSIDQVRAVLVHSGRTILPELDQRLGEYAQANLARRGMDVRLGEKVTAFDREGVHLSSGARIESDVLVWTAGTAPHPLIATLPCAIERGRVVVDDKLRASGVANVWAVGDCAVIPNSRTGRPHPPTAQHAIREAATVAGNILACVRGRPDRIRPFKFTTLGQLASLGRRTGVAQIMGIRFAGFFAWWLWRTIYLSKLPRLEKKIRVMLDWTLDLIFSKDLVQFRTTLSVPIKANAPVERRPNTSAVANVEPGSVMTPSLVG